MFDESYGTHLEVPQAYPLLLVGQIWRVLGVCFRETPSGVADQVCIVLPANGVLTGLKRILYVGAGLHGAAVQVTHFSLSLSLSFRMTTLLSFVRSLALLRVLPLHYKHPLQHCRP